MTIGQTIRDESKSRIFQGSVHTMVATARNLHQIQIEPALMEHHTEFQ